MQSQRKSHFVALDSISFMSSIFRTDMYHFHSIFISPYFQHTLKAGPFLSHLVWIMGPLSGLIVAPLVGVLSDRCTSSFGRRRPFILGGMVSCIIGMNVFANATALSFGFTPAAQWIAVFAFGLLDFSTNAIMFPSRALLGDLIPAEEQHSVQSAAAVVASLAEICAGAYISSWKDPVTHVSRVFVVASVLMALSCTVSLIVCREEPLKLDTVTGERVGCDVEMTRLSTSEARNDDEITDNSDERRNGFRKREEAEEPANNDTVEVDLEREEEEAVENVLSVTPPEDSDFIASETESEALEAISEPSSLSVRRELLMTVRDAVVNFPKPLIKVGIVYGLAWFVWFASLPFYSQWLGVDVLGGDPHADPGSPEAIKYQRGVSLFSLANVVKALFALAFSAFYPRIIKWVGNVGERVVFGTSFFVFSIALFQLAYTKSVVLAMVMIALGSVPFIVTQTIPIAIVVQRFPENLASNLGIL